MLKNLFELKKFIVSSGHSSDRIDYLIRLASVEKGIHKLDNGTVIEYNPTAPATITIKWSPDGSNLKKGQQIMQGEDGFSEIYDRIKK